MTEEVAKELLILADDVAAGDAVVTSGTWESAFREPCFCPALTVAVRRGLDPREGKDFEGLARYLEMDVGWLWRFMAFYDLRMSQLYHLPGSPPSPEKYAEAIRVAVRAANGE